MAQPYATKILGDKATQIVRSVPSVAGTDAYDIWRGPSETLSTWSANVLANYEGKRISVSLSPQGALTEMTVTDTGSGDDSGEDAQNTADDARTPTLSIAMGTYSRPIETIKSPTDFTAIAVAKIAEIRKWVRTGDAAKIAQLKGTEAAYARLFAIGVTTREDPCYTAEATRYIRLDKSFRASVGSPFEIVSWSKVVSWLGNARAKYANPDGSILWRPSGINIAIREGRYAEVSKTFEGAYWWPPELYGGTQG